VIRLILSIELATSKNTLVYVLLKWCSDEFVFSLLGTD